MVKKKICLVMGILACSIFVCSCGKNDIIPNTESSGVESVAEETVTAVAELPTETELKADNQTEPTVTEMEESMAEMIPFEIFAAQEGSDTINLVVWNETTGVQKILEPEEPYTKYVMQPGTVYRNFYTMELLGRLIRKRRP